MDSQRVDSVQQPTITSESTSPENQGRASVTGVEQGSPDTGAENEYDQVGTLWAPFLEWSLENPTYSRNPFDLEAAAIFVHEESGEERRTEMFYAGGDTWKFRFTGTRTGLWNFTTSSEDAELNGKSGRVTIRPNPNPEVKGFLTSHGHQFARQVGENGELEAYIFNIYQDNYKFPADFWDWINDRSLDYIREYPAEEWADEYLQAARENGCSTIFIALSHQWFEVGALTSEEHNSENPELLTFEMLERVISTVQEQGGNLHIWMWGDDARDWTPQRLKGGINGEVDRRLQRYIAARLGPLPGWTMSYGFDLGSRGWINRDTKKLSSWAEYLHEHSGWQHLLFTRGFAPAHVDVVSYASNGPGKPEGDLQTSPNGPESYDEIANLIHSEPDRPHFFEERFWYGREMEDGQPWTMERTRRVMWWNVMAGGAGSWWGFHHNVQSYPPSYPNPEQLRTHARFWEGRFILGMETANDLTNGYALKTPSNDQYVFYKEDAVLVEMDLSGMDGDRPAVAVDTKSEYQELSLGVLSPGVQSWLPPYRSDWAIAIGEARQ